MADLIEDINPKLASRIKAADKPAQRNVAIAAAKVAVTTLNIDKLPEVAQALRVLEAGKVDSVKDLRALKLVANNFDQLAFDANDRFEEGTGTEVEYDQAFRTARAASALVCAFHRDTYKAATRSVYEAYYALDEHIEPILLVVDAFL